MIEDSSSDGTEFLDEESLRNRIPKKTIRRRVAAYGLSRIKIGSNVFSFWPPSDDQEIFRRERWFQDRDPMLVSQNLIREQLRGAMESYYPICPVGHGGMGDVFIYMEMTTGLMIAVKEEAVKEVGADDRIQKEIAYMQNLRHVSQTLYFQMHILILLQPNLVEYITSNSATRAGVKTWFTAMPLYQGRLCDILPLDICAIEDVMLQLFDAVSYMHGKRVLHKDIKPETSL